MQELTFNIDDRRELKPPTSVENFHLTFGNQPDADLPGTNWVQGRQNADSLRQVFVNIKQGSNNMPYDVTGFVLQFAGRTAVHSDGRSYRIIDNSSVVIDGANGRLRFTFPAAAFAVAGTYKQAYFRLIREADYKCVATLEFDLSVLQDFVFSDIIPSDWVDPFNDVRKQLQLSLSDFQAQSQSDLADTKKQLQAMFDQASQRVNDTVEQMTSLGATVKEGLQTAQTALEALQLKIQQDGLFTQDAALQLQNDLRKLTTALYPTVADMVKDNDLKIGRLVRTLGFYAPNDGGGDMYRVVDQSSDGAVPLSNGLYAQKLHSGDANYYDEVTVRQERINHTDVYIATIPQYDNHGNLIMPYMAKNGTDVSYDEQGKVIHVPAPDGRDLTPTEYARAENTTLTLNGDASVLVNGQYPNTNIIGNGKVINKRAYKQAMPDNYKYVAIMADRSVREYPGELTTAQQMIDDGVQQAWLVYWPLLKDREIVDFTGFTSNEGPEKVTNENVRLGIGVKADKTLTIVATDGRSLQNRGLTSAQLAQVLKDEGCINAWHMDGGGSTSMTYKGTKVNRNIDNGGTTDRHIPYTLNVKRPDAGGAIANAYSQIGAATQAVTRKIGGDLAKIQQGTTPWLGQFKAASDDALDQWIKTDLINQMKRYGFNSGMRAYGRVTTTWGSTVSAMVNRPRPTDWILEADFTGSYANGTITMRSINAVDLSRGVRREYHNGELTPWQVFGMATPIDLSTLTIDQSQNIENPLILRAGFTVTIDFKITPTVTGTWIKLIEGLPRNNHYARPTDYFGINNATAGRSRAYVDEHGWLLYKVYELDTFDVHLVYVTID